MIPNVEIPDPETERIRSIVCRHEFPPFVTGFDLRFRNDWGIPNVFVVFKTFGEPEPTTDAIPTRVKVLPALTVAVADDLYSEVLDWSPRILFEPAEIPAHH